jgi:hypothetical protein
MAAHHIDPRVRVVNDRPPASVSPDRWANVRLSAIGARGILGADLRDDAAAAPIRRDRSSNIRTAAEQAYGLLPR